jgi:hypothetical protein
VDVTKTPAPGFAARASNTAPAEQGATGAMQGAPRTDRVDIRPLDVSGALQILLAEVRAAFDSLEIFPNVSGLTIVDSPGQAAHQLVEIVLQAIPDDAPIASELINALERIESALQMGFDRSLSTVGGWRNASPAAVESIKETRQWVFSALGDDAQNPIWLRPEWLGLAPHLERLRRRRRLARRRLLDPDYSPGSLDDEYT